MNTGSFNSKPYVRSRRAYTVQCAVEYMVSLLFRGVFLSKLLQYAGFDDATVGIMQSLVNFSYLIQIVTVPLLNYIKSKKRVVIITDTLSILLYSLAFFATVSEIGSGLKAISIWICVAGGGFARSFSLYIYYEWANSFVDPGKRASFTAVKESISLACEIIFVTLAGFILDHFESINRIDDFFIILGVAVLIISVINCGLLSLISEKNDDEIIIREKNIRGVLSNTFGNREYVRVLMSNILLSVASCLTVSFLSTYKTDELAYSVGAVQIMNSCAQLCRIGFNIPIGKYSDKHSFAEGYMLGLLFAIASYLLLVFTSPQRRWMIIVFEIVYYISLAGTGGNGTNIVYQCVKQDFFVEAQSIKSALCGTFGFVASLFGGKLLNAVQNSGNTFLGMELYGQQLLALASSLTVIAAGFFMFPCIKKANSKQRLS